MDYHAALRRATLALLPVSAFLVISPWAQGAYRPAVSAVHFAVATDHPEATRVAFDVLRAGGNAVDAAIAAALALGVASPASSGLGGGGFATVCQPDGRCTFIDFRETAPAAATVEAFRHAPDPRRATTIGGLAVAIPGEPAGLALLARRYGRFPLTRTAAGASRLARSGFVVVPALADRIRDDSANLVGDRWISSLFLRGGGPIPTGTRVRRPVLAATIERWARSPAQFIDRELAPLVSRNVRAAGGAITEADVRGYQPVERVPLSRAFRDWQIVTAPPPSAGGLIVLEVLAWIDAAPATMLAHGSSAYDHLLAEAFRAAFDDRARYVGDPGSGPSNVDALLAPARLARRRARFDPAHVSPVVVAEPAHDAGTTHVCVMDAGGTTVSLTTTINLAFGARLAVPTLDVLLNDEMFDFSLGISGGNFGLANGSPNTLAPGRRPVSSMAPTIVLRDHRPVGCVGASGGPRVATATTQVLLNLMAHGMDPEAAVSSPRIHHQGVPNVLNVEGEVPEDVRVGLRARGHDVHVLDTGVGVAQAIWVRDGPRGRRVLAAADPRKGGLALGN